MGILSDVFIALPDQITMEVLAHGPMGRLEAVEGKGLFPSSVLELWQIIDPSKESPSRRLELLDIAREQGDHIIYLIPGPVVSAIAFADNDRIREIEVAWLYRGTPPPPDPLDGILKDWFEEFIRLLKRAHRRGLNAYVWLCP